MTSRTVPFIPEGVSCQVGHVLGDQEAEKS